MHCWSMALPPLHLRRPTVDAVTFAAKRYRERDILHALGPFEKNAVAHPSRIRPLERFQFEHRGQEVGNSFALFHTEMVLFSQHVA